jgi:translation initiation factor 2B subunit (eIF-2B alpha/beta/delta family)
MFSPTLSRGVHNLRNDRDSGARVLATNAVGFLKDILVDESTQYHNGEELWNTLRYAAWQLKNSRPSMGAAISSALLQALSAVKRGWEKQPRIERWADVEEATGVTALVEVGKIILDSTIEERKESGQILAKSFTSWLQTRGDGVNHPLRILTLSYSSSLRSCLTTAIRESCDIRVELYIMESRPRCEGVTFGIALANDTNKVAFDRLSIEIAPDSSVAMLSQNIDIVLLGADRISSSGDISNKMGSLAAAVCAKVISPAAKVVVVSESDKIAKPGLMEEHAPEENDQKEVTALWGNVELPENIQVKNSYFEWVPAKWIDAYIMESGVSGKEEILRMSLETEQKEKEYFGPFQ